MTEPQTIRNAIMDIKFGLQGGVHDGQGNDMTQYTPEEALDELLRRLKVDPVSVRPFYTFNWNGDEKERRPHLLSRITNKRYWTNMKAKDVEVGTTLYEGIELKTVATKNVIVVRIDGKDVECETEKDVKDRVGQYEREKGITK